MASKTYLGNPLQTAKTHTLLTFSDGSTLELVGDLASFQFDLDNKLELTTSVGGYIQSAPRMTMEMSPGFLAHFKTPSRWKRFKNFLRRLVGK